MKYTFIINGEETKVESHPSVQLRLIAETALDNVYMQHPLDEFQCHANIPEHGEVWLNFNLSMDRQFKILRNTYPAKGQRVIVPIDESTVIFLSLKAGVGA